MRVPLFPITEEEVTAEELLKIKEENNHNIEKIQIIPASIKSRSFGSFLIKYKTPIFKSLK